MGEKPKCKYEGQLLDDGSSRDLIGKAVLEHKWYLSEMAGKDVGLDFAVKDFITKDYLFSIILLLKYSFCNNFCELGPCVLRDQTNLNVERVLKQSYSYHEIIQGLVEEVGPRHVLAHTQESTQE